MRSSVSVRRFPLDEGDLNRCPLNLGGHLLGLKRLWVGLSVAGQVPGQQFGDAIDGVIGDAREHGPEIVFRVDAVELGRTDEGVEGGSLSAGIGANEEVVLPAHSNGAQRAFGGVVIYLQPAVIDIARQCAPV